jgi:carboxylesterase
MRGALLIHGLTETPACVGPLKDRLEEAGFVTLAPCLAGHGGTIDDLARSTWQEWYASVQAAYELLRRAADAISVVGISLGALLCLKLALEDGIDLRALALLATPLTVRPVIRLALPFVRSAPLRYVLRAVPKDYSKSAADPWGRKFYREHSLKRIPIAAVSQIAELQHHLIPQLRHITKPILIVHAQHDLVAPPENMELLRRSVGSSIVETLELTKSRHVVTLDVERELIAERVIRFFRNVGDEPSALAERPGE